MRFALFGAGRVGLVHAENIVNHPDAELKYVFDINQDASLKITKHLVELLLKILTVFGIQMR